MSARVDITLSGLEGALADLSALPADAKAAVQEAVQAVARSTKRRAIKLTTQRYNLDEETLDPYVALGKTGITPYGGASVRLKARPIPISVFSPQVRMKTFTLTSSRARTYKRKLPTVLVKRFRKGGAKPLKPFFPLRQRANGPLAASDAVRKRTGSKVSAKENRMKLTGPRFYTFPKRFLDEIRPQLIEHVGEQGSLELRAAWRKRHKGYRVLRGPR